MIGKRKNPNKPFHVCACPVLDYSAGVWVLCERVKNCVTRYFLGARKYALKLALVRDMGWELEDTVCVAQLWNWLLDTERLIKRIFIS